MDDIRDEEEDSDEDADDSDENHMSSIGNSLSSGDEQVYTSGVLGGLFFILVPKHIRR